jgi:SP family myo-inositol transporter-like MFS transporter 13
MVAFNNMSVTFGQLVASARGAGCATVPGESWRATVGIGAAPAILLAGMLFWCPESPRQLVSHGRTAEADQVLLRLYPTSSELQRKQKMALIISSCEQATENSLSNESLYTGLARIFTNGQTGRAVLTACIVMAISQLGGFNTLMYYSATLFSIVGFNNATAVAITVSGTNFVFSILNLVLVDKFGRRRLLTVTVLGMSICMLIAAVSFSYIPINLATLEVESTQISWPGTIVLVTIICYVGFYSTGVATIAWIGTELIPNEARALGYGFISLNPTSRERN